MVMVMMMMMMIGGELLVEVVVVVKIENDFLWQVPAFVSCTEFQFWIKTKLSDPKFMLLVCRTQMYAQQIFIIVERREFVLQSLIYV